MEPALAVLDACVLYPAPLRDALLEIAVSGLYQPRWTEDIHAEWISHVLANRPDLKPGQLARTQKLMEKAFPDALVVTYRQHIEKLHLPDEKDRHVLAAAIASKSTIIVTFNGRDFPKRELAPLDIEAITPDIFLCHLFDESAESVCAAIRRLRERLKRPPLQVDAYLERLKTQGVPEFAEMLRAERNKI